MGRKSTGQESFDFDSRLQQKTDNGQVRAKRSAEIVDMQGVKNRLHAARVLESLKDAGLVKTTGQDEAE